MRFSRRKPDRPTGPDGPLIVIPHARFPLPDVATNAVLAAVGVVFALPLLWLVLASVDSNAGWRIRVPNLTIGNYRAVLTAHGLQPFLNSLYLAVVTTAVATILALLAAYPLSRRHVPGKRTVMLLVLFASGLPVTMMLVPIYEMYATLHWLELQFYNISVPRRDRIALRDLAAEELHRCNSAGT